jgi:hypothetical protein
LQRHPAPQQYAIAPRRADLFNRLRPDDYALSRQSDFAPTRLGSKAVDPSIRVSTGLRDLGGYRQILNAKILGLVPRLIAQLHPSKRFIDALLRFIAGRIARRPIA